MYEKKLLSLRCSSVLAQYLRDFVEQKRALGKKYNACVEVFNIFDRFCIDQGLTSISISREMLSSWEEKRPHENATTQKLRISYVRQLCEYLHNNGYDAPGAFHPMPKKSQEFVPYIFSKEELRKFFAAIDSTKPSSVSPLRHLVMPVLFRLIYTCGLRVNEALRLKIDDVDLEQGILTIYSAKGNRDRMVGISDSMIGYMSKYRADATVAEFKSEYFFPAPDGGFYDSSTIYSHFREYLFTAGIPHKGRGKGPRVHDLRHTFAVHVLNKWSTEGKDMYTCLPILRVYLGHCNLKGTEKYLRLIPDAYEELTDPFKNRFQNITEVLSNEEKE